MKNKDIPISEMKPSDFRRMVLKSLHSEAITKDEAKALIRNSQNQFGIFLFQDDLTDEDYLKKSGLEKMGFFAGIIFEGTGKYFSQVE